MFYDWVHLYLKHNHICFITFILFFVSYYFLCCCILGFFFFIFLYIWLLMYLIMFLHMWSSLQILIAGLILWSWAQDTNFLLLAADHDFKIQIWETQQDPMWFQCSIFRFLILLFSFFGVCESTRYSSLVFGLQ